MKRLACFIPLATMQMTGCVTTILEMLGLIKTKNHGYRRSFSADCLLRPDTMERSRYTLTLLTDPNPDYAAACTTAFMSSREISTDSKKVNSKSQHHTPITMPSTT